MRPSLFALTLGAFALGTTEFVIVGLLPTIAADLGVSVPSLGTLVAVYAVGIAIGGPLLTTATARLGRRPVLLATLLAFVAANALAGLAPTYAVLFAARLVGGAAHGLFFSLATVVAPGLVAPEQRGRAVAAVFGGLTLATVLGVPFGTLLGAQLGWRAAFAGVVVLGAAAVAAIIAFVPRVAAPPALPLATQLAVLRRRPVVLTLTLTALLTAGDFTAFTYLVPFLGEVTGVRGSAVTAVLLAFGVATVAGNFLGGRGADHNVTRTLVLSIATLGTALLGLFLLGDIPALAIACVMLWATASFAFIPAVHCRILTLGGDVADIASSLDISAFNVGIALGAAIGGLVVGTGSVRAVALVGAVIAAGALVLVLATRTAAADASAVASAEEPGVEAFEHVPAAAAA